MSGLRFALTAFAVFAVACSPISASAQAAKGKPAIDKAALERATPEQRTSLMSCVEREVKSCAMPVCKAGKSAEVDACMAPYGKCRATKVRNCGREVLGSTRS